MRKSVAVTFAMTSLAGGVCRLLDAFEFIRFVWRDSAFTGLVTIETVPESSWNDDPMN